MSETAASREVLAPYCQGIGLDLGYGGDKVCVNAWAFDMPHPYTKVGDDRQQLRGDCRSLPFICDGALDFAYSSHLVEDMYYHEAVEMIREWRRVLRVGGLLVTNCPDQQRFKAWIAKTGQGDNLSHREWDFSLKNFKERILAPTGPWELVYEMPDDGRYSFYIVVRKLADDDTHGV
jgi:SAM-dependent methyltransferase